MSSNNKLSYVILHTLIAEYARIKDKVWGDSNPNTDGPEPNPGPPFILPCYLSPGKSPRIWLRGKLKAHHVIPFIYHVIYFIYHVIPFIYHVISFTSITWYLSSITWYLSSITWYLSSITWYISSITWYLSSITWYLSRLSRDTFHLSRDTFHLSRDIFHLSRDSFHLSRDIFHLMTFLTHRSSLKISTNESTAEDDFYQWQSGGRRYLVKIFQPWVA